MFVEAVTRLHRALETVQPESPRHFYNLAATQIRRVLIDLSRRYYGAEGLGSHHDTAARNAEGDAPPKYEQADESGEPASLMEWTEFHEQVEALPEEEREVFNLVWYEQLTHEQAAEVLGVTARTVRRRWQDARYRLCKARMGEPLPENDHDRRPTTSSETSSTDGRTCASRGRSPAWRNCAGMPRTLPSGCGNGRGC